MRERFHAVVDGVVFTSKKALTEKCKEYLYAPIMGTGAHCFLLSLIQRHPNAKTKIGCGVKHFTVRINQPFGTKGFWIERFDGTCTDFSYLACITPPSKENEARKAFRDAINPQIQEFKADCFRSAFAGRGPEAQFIRCPISGTTIGRANAHVDHKPPKTFEAILQAFLKETNRKLEDIKVNPTEDGSIVTTLANEQLARDWRWYHRCEAELQLVSATANLSQGKGR